MTLGDRFDAWVHSGRFSRVDLGIYRIIFSISLLLTLPDITWITSFPDDFLRPPIGPFQLMTAVPPYPFLVGLEIARSAALVLLGLGLYTRLMSVLVAFLLTTTLGLGYVFGHVHHTILLVLTPLVLCFADWGSQVSLDSRRRNPVPGQQQQWPLRILALTVGFAFFAAALPKLLGGWLAPTSQATKGYFYAYYFTPQHPTSTMSEPWLAGAATHLHSVAAWELIDWLTVLLEFGILLAVPWWSAFRSALAIATVFHLGVFLLVGISFTPNVIVYGAFVSWSRYFSTNKQRPEGVRGHPAIKAGPASVGLIGFGFVTTWLLIARHDPGVIADPVIVAIGAVIGLGYLARSGRSVVRRL